MLYHFKVLHLMNKMNLPTPFGPITARPPMVRKFLEFSRFKISPVEVRLLRLNSTNVVPLMCTEKRYKYKVNAMIAFKWRTESGGKPEHERNGLLCN